MNLTSNHEVRFADAPRTWLRVVRVVDQDRVVVQRNKQFFLRRTLPHDVIAVRQVNA